MVASTVNVSPFSSCPRYLIVLPTLAFKTPHSDDLVATRDWTGVPSKRNGGAVKLRSSKGCSVRLVATSLEMRFTALAPSADEATLTLRPNRSASSDRCELQGEDWSNDDGISRRPNALKLSNALRLLRA